MIQLPFSKGPVYISDVLDTLPLLLQSIPHSRIFIITDDHVLKHCLSVWPAMQPFQCITIPPGEQNKTLRQCEWIWTALADAGADRQTLLLLIGGGMITDLGGYAAACYQRGVRFVHIPTSLLGMTDAAIGGKTAVDFRDIKNYIGLFAFPEFVWIWPGWLKTLPGDELLGGLAEVVKHAIIGSRVLWDKLQAANHVGDLDWPSILEISIRVKLDLVERDPYDRNERKVLNFGHTIGHALESHFMHSAAPLTHGQAVTLGMMAESWMAREAGLLAGETFDQIINLTERLLLPVRISVPDHATLAPWLDRDKKRQFGYTSYSLPDAIGHCLRDIRVEDADPALNWLRKHVSPRV